MPIGLPPELTCCHYDALFLTPPADAGVTPLLYGACFHYAAAFAALIEMRLLSRHAFVDTTPWHYYDY